MSPYQYDELIQAADIDPVGEKRADMRVAYIISCYMNFNSPKNVDPVTVHDVYAHMLSEFAGDTPEMLYARE